MIRKVCPMCNGNGYGPEPATFCGLCNGQGQVRGDLELEGPCTWPSPFERFVLHAAALIAIALIVMIAITWS